MQHMLENMERIKKLSKEWGQRHKSFSQNVLIEIENKIQEIFNLNKTGIFTNEELESLKNI